MIVIKFNNHKDIRRVAINDETLTYEQLRILAISLYTTIDDSFVFKYRDEDGDQVTVSSEDEVVEAFRVMKPQNILRFNIVSKDTDVRGVKFNAENRRKCPLRGINDVIQQINGNIVHQSKQLLKLAKPETKANQESTSTGKEKEIPSQCEDHTKESTVENSSENSSEPPMESIDVLRKKHNKRGAISLTQVLPISRVNLNKLNPKYGFKKCSSLFNPQECRKQWNNDTTTTSTTATTEVNTATNTATTESVSPSVSVPVETEVFLRDATVIESESKPQEQQPQVQSQPTYNVVSQHQSPVQHESQPIPLQHPQTQVSQSPSVLAFNTKLRQLEEMGFLDNQKNIQVLVKSKGDILEAVKILVE